MLSMITLLSLLSFIRSFFNRHFIILSGKQKILLVDDSALICKRLNTILSELPFVEVLGEAMNGDEAIEKITLLMPDIVLLDINIPGTSGFNILIWLRASYKQMKVIMLSNHAQQEYRDMAFSLGADYFLDKASEFDQLPALIADINNQF